MNIKKILEFFKKKEQHNYILKTDDDIEDYSNDRKIKQTLKHYEKSKEDAYNYDPKNILRKRELARFLKYLIKFDFLPSLQRSMNVRSASQFLTGDYIKWTEIRDHIEILNGSICACCAKTSFYYQKILIKEVKKKNEEIRKANKESKKKTPLLKIEEGETYIFTDEEKNITTATECHEQWSFSKVGGQNVQKLEKLIPLCFVCHATHHLNQHSKNEKYRKYLLNHYVTLNKITIEQAEKDFKYCVEMRKELDEKYLLDMSLINKINVGITFNELFDCHNEDFLKFLRMNFNIDDND